MNCSQSPPLTPAAVGQLAIDRLRVADAAVFVQNVEHARDFDNSPLSGQWYWLMVKDHPLGEWRLVARRRSVPELLALVESRSCPWPSC